jgi:hypothetical protein
MRQKTPYELFILSEAACGKSGRTTSNRREEPRHGEFDAPTESPLPAVRLIAADMNPVLAPSVKQQ